MTTTTLNAAVETARRGRETAVEAVEHGIDSARRAMTRGVHDAEDLRDEAVHRIRRAPFTTVALAIGAGILVGWVIGRARAKRP